MRPVRAILIWAALALAIGVPMGLAATSPLLAWRDTIYIAAGFAGILGLALLLLQPLLAANALPGLSRRRSRVAHGWVGAALLSAVVLHVAGLWVTSPPDVIDALLFRSPTPFSVWGVIAMWAVLAAAMIALLRRRLRLAPNTWRTLHVLLALVIVVGTVIHAVLIEGTMETISKFALCAFALAAAVRVALRLWLAPVTRRIRTTPSR